MTETTTRKPTSPRSKVPHPARPLKLWHDHSHEQEVRIEIIPLIDVIFCILTFFILGAVGLSRQQAIDLDLPKASTGSPQMREMLVVSLDDFGQVYVEKQPVTMNQLYDALKNYHQFNPNGLMVLHASRNTSYNEVVQILDLLRQVGGDRVALGTLPGQSASPDSWTTTSPNLNPLAPGTSLPGSYPNSLPPNFPSNPSQGLGSPPLNPSNPSNPNPSNPSLPSAPGTP